MLAWCVAVCLGVLLAITFYGYVKRMREHDEIVHGLHAEFGKIEAEYKSKLRELGAMHKKAREEIDALADQYGKIVKDIVVPIEFLRSLPLEALHVEGRNKFSYCRPIDGELVYEINDESRLSVEVKEGRLIEYGVSCAVHVPDSSKVTRSQRLDVIHASLIAHGAKLFAEAVGREAGLAL